MLTIAAHNYPNGYPAGIIYLTMMGAAFHALINAVFVVAILKGISYLYRDEGSA